MSNRKLYRSRENAMIGGVCAGLADYFNIDSTIVRLATVILIFPGGLSIWAYIIAWIIIPQKPLLGASEMASDGSATTAEGEVSSMSEDESPLEEKDKSRFIVGTVLIALGALFLLNAFDVFYWFSFGKVWPAILIIVGVVVLFKAVNKGGEKDES